MRNLMSTRAALLAASLLAAGLLAPALAPAASEAVRPAVGKPLEAAKADLARHDFAKARDEVARAEHARDRSDYENFLIDEMKGAIAQQSGDTDAATAIYAKVIASGRVSGAQLQSMLLAEVSLNYQVKNYANVITWSQKYYKAGGKNPVVRTLVIQAYYLQRDYANAAQLQSQVIDEDLAAKKTPPEDQLQLLAACQKALKQSADLTKTMELLVTYYPKQSYWADLVYAVQTTPGFSDRLDLGLDMFKLRVGLLTTEPQFMEAIQVALGDNDSGTALRFIAAAQAANLFGKPGYADRENRLIALAKTQAAQTQASLAANLKQLTSSPATTSQQLYDLGRQYCGFKQFDQGTQLIQQAIAKGDLPRPDMARLRLAEAYINAGMKPQATETLNAIPESTDGTSGLAKLWLLWLNTQKTLSPV